MIIMSEEIRPIRQGISFKKYLEEIFSENAKSFSKMLCEYKLNIETERSISFVLVDQLGNERELKITLRDLDE